MAEYLPVPRKKGLGRVALQTIVAFFFTLILCFSMLIVMVSNWSRVERLTMEQLILVKSGKIDDVITKLLNKTQMLATLVLQSDGDVENFGQVAAAIIDDPAILNILIAPDGVVSEVYPLAGNEAVVGLDFFSEGAGNQEAILAKESGQLVLGGPFDAVQGGQVLVGRLPVYLDEPDGKKRFWGLVSVTLKYPQALDGAGLNELEIQGLAYEIWRINPDSGEKQILAGSESSGGSRSEYIEKHIPLLNADWYFRMAVRDWYAFPETWIFALISTGVSVLVAAVIYGKRKLKLVRDDLEEKSNMDPLTGIYNRRYFMDAVAKLMNRVIRSNTNSFVILFDLDYFKQVNDKYGHQAGDEVLKEIAERVSNALRSYDLFARYGGEEFIIFVSELDQESVMQLVERVRMDIAKMPVTFKEISVPITASFGVAPAAPRNNLDTAIAIADKALYQAKADGRNSSVFYGAADDSEGEKK